MYYDCTSVNSCSNMWQCTCIGWRPAFKFYNKWVALFGAAVCVAIMFIIRWYYALITFVIVVILYKIVDFLKPGKLQCRAREGKREAERERGGVGDGDMRKKITCTNFRIDINWGSSTQAFLYSYSMRNMLKLEKLEDHVKNFRYIT